MDVLTALAAFAAIMVVFSTIVTVAVEAVHKLFCLRRSGMDEMLRSLYDGAIGPRLANLNGDPGASPEDANPAKVSRAAQRFARDATESHSFAGKGRWWWLRNIPLLNLLFQRRFERLTTLQFAEQMARTEAGRTLLKTDRDTQRAVLGAVAYEFERFGDAQSDYFRRRAKVLSVAVGLVVAASLNLDAVALFRSLYSNPDAAQGVLAAVDTEQLNTLAASAQQKTQALAASPVAEEGQPQADTAAIDNLESDIETLTSEVKELRAAAASMSTLEVAYGAGIFPYCRAEAGAARDSRCGDTLGYGGLWTAEQRAALAARLQSSAGDTAVWLLSLAGMAGLLGLGAPFWFNLFRKLAGYAPTAKLTQLVRADVADPVMASSATASKPRPVRDTDASGQDALLRAFTIAAGGNEGWEKPPAIASSPGAMEEMQASG